MITAGSRCYSILDTLKTATREQDEDDHLSEQVLDIDQALAAASVKGRVTVTWPTDKDPVWKVAGGRDHFLQVEDASGRIAAARGDDRQRTRSFYRRLHDGTGMGLFWQIIIFLGGLAPAVLGVTGILMWLRTRTWRTEVARRKAAVTA